MSRYILPHFPGYSVVENELKWVPIKNVYSPPVFETNVHCHSIPLTHQILKFIGNIIGKDGYHFKSITHTSSSLYIYIRHGHIEIWTTSNRSLEIACNLLYQHIDQKMMHYGYLKMTVST